MRTLEVALGDRSYPIVVGSGLYADLPRWLQLRHITPAHSLLVVTDSSVAPHYGKRVLTPLESAGYRVQMSVVPAGEASKSLDQLSRLVEEAIRFGMDRDSAVLALGGGVVGDLAGFLAAVYMRGIRFVQLPTTLLAHDSSVGGKTGVNHPLGKNMIGAFHQPELVLFDVDTLATLPERELASGFAEVIKHALIADADFAMWLEQHHEALLRRDPTLLTEAIVRGCAIKAQVVARDERESGLRAILNYGHTIGHALEAATGYRRWTHGEAVAIGMVGEAILGELLGTARDVSGFTRRLLALYGLPVTLDEPLSDEELLTLMRRDKKARQGEYVFVLPKGIGTVEVKKGVEERVIREALRRLKEE
jgi:3-dehydroquinate synthase